MRAGRPLKVLLLIHDVSMLGGMEVQLVYLANGLARAGHSVTLASIRSAAGSFTHSEISLRPDVELLLMGASSRSARIKCINGLRKLALDADIVHCTGWDTSLWGRLAAISARRRVIIADHAGSREHQVSAKGSPRARWIALHNRLLDPFTSATVVCAARQEEQLIREGVAREKVVLIPNGVPVDEMRARAHDGLTREALGIPPEAKVLAHVASFRPIKRQALALETVERLRREVGDVRIVFAGTGPELDSVRNLARRMGAEWATFLGPQRNVASVFGLADLTVLPSSSEAMPMVIIESFAVGVPVVATDVGDVAGMLERAGAGIAVPVNDHDALHDAIRLALTDHGVSDRLKRAADAAKAEIDAETMVERYEDVFRAALAGRPVA